MPCKLMLILTGVILSNYFSISEFPVQSRSPYLSTPFSESPSHFLDLVIILAASLFPFAPVPFSSCFLFASLFPSHAIAQQLK